MVLVREDVGLTKLLPHYCDVLGTEELSSHNSSIYIAFFGILWLTMAFQPNTLVYMGIHM